MLGIFHGMLQTNLVPFKSSPTSPDAPNTQSPGGVSSAAAGRLDKQDLLVAFPVEHGYGRVELVVELCGQRPGVGGAPWWALGRASAC